MLTNLIYSFILLLLHPVHVSVSNIDYSEKSGCFEISLKIFVNDLEAVIDKKYNVKLNLGMPDQIADCDDYIYRYIAENYSIVINNKKRSRNKLVLKNKKIIEDSIWLYYELKGVTGNVRNIYIKNSILTDAFKDQNNLLIINYFNFQKGYNFKIDDDSVKIEL
jgi:hypothetical protein